MTKPSYIPRRGGSYVKESETATPKLVQRTEEAPRLAATIAGADDAMQQNTDAPTGDRAARKKEGK